MKFFKRSSKLKKTQNVLLSLVLLVAQVAPFISFPQVAQAAQLCTVDSAGANDQPGQKDLTQMCVDYANAPTTINVIWSWDELGSSGNNTLDGCSLFDTDNDGNVNYSVCVTTTGNPAVLNARTTYSCGDTKADRCTSTALVVSSGSTVCSVTQPLTGDPFAAGDSYPKDTKADCVIDLSTVGGSSSRLVDACSYPSGQPNSDPSDCILARAKAGKLEVVKSLSPSNDPGLFDLQIDTVTKKTNATNGGSTGELVVDEGDHSVGELAGTGTLLSNYTSGIICKDLNGTGAIVAQGSGTILEDVPVADGSDVICTITNTRQNGSLTVVKNLVKNNGGTESVTDFGFQVNGGSVTPFEADGSNTITYPSGTVITSVTEPAESGYATTYSNCSNLTIVAGQTQTCTITNNDVPPSLTLNKVVVNDNGGTSAESAWTLTATGPTNLSGSGAAGSTDVFSGAGFSAGTYTLSESGPGGYEASSWSCTNDVSVNGNNQITLGLGQTTVCTITNNDIAPQLKLVKTVTNDNGGIKTAADFQGRIDGNDVDWDVFNSVSAGLRTASEVNLPGYTAGSWGGDCNSDGTINLSVGQVATCTITNTDDAPSLTLIKNLIDNYNSGALNTDWTLYATGPTSFSGTTGVTSDADFDAGSYELSEDGPSAPGFINGDWDCGEADLNGATLTVSLGDDITCTVTNTSVQPRVKVIKHVVDNYGGDKEADDFELTLNGDDVTLTPGDNSTDNSVSFPGDENGTYVYLDAGVYDVSEGNHDGYEMSQSGYCDDEIEVGEEKTCTITNTAIAPKLVVAKTVVNDNGGTKAADDFTMTVTGTDVSDESFSGNANGTEITLDAGSYSVDELDDSGYSKSFSGDCSGEIAVGETKYCTITNDDIAPKLTLKKVVVNDNGGNEEPEDWTLTATPTSDNDQDPCEVLSGNGDDGVDDAQACGSGLTGYDLSEEGPDGYTAGSWDCDGGDQDGDNISLSAGDDVTCTITNDDVAPLLTLYKEVVNNNSGEATHSDWTLTATPEDENLPTLSGDGHDGFVEKTAYASQTYMLSEDGPDGYTASDWNCYSTAGTFSEPEGNGTVRMSEGAEVICTITNDDVPHPSILVEKYGPDTAHEGDMVDYYFYVTNTGDVDLTNVEVEDNIASDAAFWFSYGDDDDVLEVGETWVYNAYYVIPDDQEDNVINTVTACADMYEEEEYEYDYKTLDVLLDQVVENYEHEFDTCDTDDHELDVLHPAINIVKTGPASAKAGETVTYTFTVTNPGDVALDDITVVDSLIGDATYVSGDTNDDQILDLDETWIYTGQYKIPADQKANVVNVVEACGSEPYLQEEVSRESLIVIDQPDPRYCDEDDHSLKISITIVLAKTGVPGNYSMLVGLILIGGALYLARPKTKLDEEE